MEIIGYLAAILIGVVLGLIGGGGSILTVPLLVYLFGINPVTATSYSLFIVGLTSTVGSIHYFRMGLVNIKTAFLFGIPSIIAVFITRAYILPAIPYELITIGTFIVTKDIFLMLLFAMLMIGASYNMIKKSNINSILDENQKWANLKIALKGIMVGTITGLVGAGGGFLIIPALVLLRKLPMKEAVGTSLLIIASNSLIGFLGKSKEIVLDWNLLFMIAVFAIFGIFIGTFISKKIDGAKLKPAFGWFILFMGVYIILKETILK
ncbi:MAG TPA: sulfite exporter TauE/SafE family protein [Saprospiraceae bacterium]|jgi:uncharacterized membrane protein YfcA|nr:sulfite exporter TauE/SafE family protein [Saprospiraceae bacterium]HOJ90241.1 sulfite exporter TauE/SafE family protein [Saprospiraceae bacterium]HUN15779.1 sulfite exporter TauE/SafE family protein [Saprospiraceae bacterium]